MGDKRWIGPGNAETKYNDSLGRFHFQCSHFEASYVLTGRDDCGGNYIPQSSWSGRVSAVTATNEGTTNNLRQKSHRIVGDPLGFATLANSLINLKKLLISLDGFMTWSRCGILVSVLI